MTASVVYCAYCTRQRVELYVHLDTVREVGAVALECPVCHRLTQVGFGSSNELVIVPGGKRAAPGAKPGAPTE